MASAILCATSRFLIASPAFFVASKISAANFAENDLKINKMNLDAEVKALEMRAETLKSKDDFLHKEIEWLVLDKQRAEMTRLTQENN